jgi:hypothetical protein
MRLCRDHRDYLSAIADGELDLVPHECAAHVLVCHECGHEVETQRHLTRLLAHAAGESEAKAPRPRRIPARLQRRP